ncbi:MAG: hypothetical protein M1821_003996 [Bathelium mastoideum]|nr:MAG: hypothetical protein M1821_003996 [Bathelium mastoideum]
MTSTEEAKSSPTDSNIITTPPSTHSLPSDCLFSPYAATTINAPAFHVAKCILDSARYPEWNTFIPEVTITYDPPPAPSDTSRPKGWLQAGTKMTFLSKPKGAGGGSSFNSKEEVTVVEIPPSSSSSSSEAPDHVYSIRWGARGFPSFMMRAERFQELRMLPPTAAAANSAGGEEGEEGAEDGVERCDYRTWETFAGPLARVVRMQFGKLLDERFVDLARDLKGFAERTWAERAS